MSNIYMQLKAIILSELEEARVQRANASALLSKARGHKEEAEARFKMCLDTLYKEVTIDILTSSHGRQKKGLMDTFGAKETFGAKQ